MLLDSWHSVLSAPASRAGPSQQPQRLPRDHPSVPGGLSGLSPPPGCPMHQSDAGSSSSSTGSAALLRGARPSSSSNARASSPSSEASLAKAAAAAAASGSSSTGGGAATRSWSETLNPLNMMPFLSNTRASEKQKVVLPTDRTVSSIPRTGGSAPPGASPYDAPAGASSSGPAKCPVKHDGSGSSSSSSAAAAVSGGAASAGGGDSQYWEYPSPQQFYNALVRKGWETPEEHVEMMVLIHNWLNEAAWKEVLEWERFAGVDPSKVELARFQGKPGTLSPKARIYTLLGQIMPSRFQSEPPFDRHDWIVRRPPPAGASADTTPQEVRYIIDYYSVPESEQANPDDEPEFVLDIRPALDSVGSAWVRVQKTWDEWAAGQGQQ